VPWPLASPRERPSAKPQQALSALLLEVQGTGGQRLDPADAAAKLGYLGADARVGEDADAERQGDGADVVAALDRQAERHGGHVGVGELAVTGRVASRRAGGADLACGPQCSAAAGLAEGGEQPE
jgi:hypothetical protein